MRNKLTHSIEEVNGFFAERTTRWSQWFILGFREWMMGQNCQQIHVPKFGLLGPPDKKKVVPPTVHSWLTFVCVQFQWLWSGFGAVYNSNLIYEENSDSKPMYSILFSTISFIWVEDEKVYFYQGDL